MQLLYALLSEQPENDEVDLGIYLSNIASAVLAAHAVEGIRLNLQVDVYPVSVNVAMPTGLVVNELLTNALKYAFEGRDGGTITLHSFTENNGCRIVIADDGVGLPDGVQWPQRGKLSAAIVHSLRENAKAKLTMVSRPGEGVKVTILFQREAALPNA
jgi:two-component sensor histidine kinase